MPLIALTIAAAVAIGVAAERRRPAQASAAARRLLEVMLYWLFPPIVFLNLAHLELTTDVGAGIGLGWVAIAVTGVLAHLVGTRLLGLDRPQTGTLINASLQPNSGYLGLPLCAAVLGTGSLDQAIAYDTLVSSPALLLGVFGVGAAYGAHGGTGLRERGHAFLMRNPPLIAAVLGLLAPSALAPEPLVDASRVVVFALLPLGFFAVGVTLAEERLGFPPPFTGRIAAALVLRLAVAPALLFLLAAALIDLPTPYLLMAAMPAGLNGLVVAHAFGLDLRFAAGAIAWGTAVVVAVGTVAVLAVA